MLKVGLEGINFIAFLIFFVTVCAFYKDLKQSHPQQVQLLQMDSVLLTCLAQAA